MTVVVFGGGGHAKVVSDTVCAAGTYRLIGFLDDRLALGTKLTPSGCSVLGTRDWLRTAASSGVSVALGVGDNAVRSEVMSVCESLGIHVATLIHPSAIVSRSASLGVGTVVMPLAVVNADAVVGKGAILNTGVIVEHDCVVGDFAHLSPRVSLGGGSRVGAGAHLGLGAVVLPGISVGESSIVGAGAVVVRPVPECVVAVGVPASVRRSLKEQS
ncbi:MAG: acetyltransferase [Gemmatimonadota bacterium]|nr:acetyltransferase [Gemmatimonadota bacterium]